MKQIALIVAVLSIATSSVADDKHHNEDKHHDKDRQHQEDEHSHGDHARATHRFEDAEKWSKIFDHPSRAEWQQPERIVEILTLSPGMSVADIGAGTGYFNLALANAVTESGKVFAVDIEPNLIDHMRERAVEENTPQVLAVLGAADNPKLPVPVDRILLVDTYHHIGERRAYFRRLKASLNPEGRLVTVDWKPGKLELGPSPEHKLAPGEVIAEMKEAGYALERREDMKYQYVLIFTPVKSDQ